MKKYLITGGAGFIGSNLVLHILSQGSDVKVYDNFYGGKFLERLSKDVEYVEGDILDREKLEKSMKDVDGVFHMAAIPRMPFSIEYPWETNQTNVDGTLSVLLAARNSGAQKVVYSSSSSVYGRQEGSPPFSEKLKANPISPYGLQKFAGEEYVRLFHEVYKVQTLSLRYFNVYGPFQRADGAYASVVVKFLEQKKNNQPLTVCGDGLFKRDFTNVADVVRANFLAMTAKVGEGQAINIGYGSGHTVLELAKMISDDMVFVDERPGDSRFSEADISLAKSLIGWEPKISLREGVAEMKKIWEVV